MQLGALQKEFNGCSIQTRLTFIEEFLMKQQQHSAIGEAVPADGDAVKKSVYMELRNQHRKKFYRVTTQGCNVSKQYGASTIAPQGITYQQTFETAQAAVAFAAQ